MRNDEGLCVATGGQIFAKTDIVNPFEDGAVTRNYPSERWRRSSAFRRQIANQAQSSNIYVFKG